MSERGGGRGTTIVLALAALGALVAVVLAARPVFTDAQSDGSTVAAPSQADRIASASPGGVHRLAGSPDLTGQPRPDPDDESGRPSLVYIDGSLEVAPDDVFTTVLEVVDAPAGSDLAVQIYDRVTTVEQLDASATDLPANLLATFDTIPLAEADPPTSQLSTFSISLYRSGQPRPPEAGAWAYRLDEPGVYPVRVRLRGPDGDQLDSFVTYLARTSDDAEAGSETPADEAPPPATEVALVARIHEAAAVDGSEAAPAIDRAIDDDSLMSIERFLATITDRTEIPVTFSITPDTARRMHQNGSSLPTAESLRAALVDDDRVLMGSPYVEIDTSALLAEDLGVELDSQIMLGAQQLDLAVGRAGVDAWLIERPIDATTVDALAARSLTGAVLGPDVLTEPHHSPVTVGGSESTLTGVPVFDPGLAGAWTSSEGGRSNALAAHHAVGRLAALRGLESSDGAKVAVSIDPDIDPERLEEFLDLIGTTPDHVQLTRLNRLIAGGTTATAELTEPTSEIGSGLADRIRATRLRVESYRSMLATDSPNIDEFDLPLAIALDVERSDAVRDGDLDGITTTIDERFDAIATPERDRVTLGTRDATFPLPVTTGSAEPLQVRVDIQASDRVELPRSSFETTVSGERTVIQIPVRTRASGDTTLLISISTPNGEVVLTESRYTIRSTAVSGVGVLLTIGAGGFLAVWWGRHWYRTRHARATPARHART